jgi:hypothetical protein
MPDDPETLTLRPTVIAGHRCEDDFVVIWRGMSIGRIRKASGAPHDTAQWTWSCRLHGRPQGSDERGSGADLDDAKLQFRTAWAQIRASLTRSGHRKRTSHRRDQHRNSCAVWSGARTLRRSNACVSRRPAPLTSHTRSGSRGSRSRKRPRGRLVPPRGHSGLTKNTGDEIVPVFL